MKEHLWIILWVLITPFILFMGILHYIFKSLEVRNWDNECIRKSYDENTLSYLSRVIGYIVFKVIVIHTDNIFKRYSSPEYTSIPAIIIIAFSIYGYLIYLLFSTLYKML